MPARAAMLLLVLPTCPTSLSPSAGRRGDVQVRRASHRCFGASWVRLDTHFRAEGIPCLYVHSGYND